MRACDAAAGLGHLISLAKPRSLPLPGAIRPGHVCPLGNEQEAERWRRGKRNRRRIKKREREGEGGGILP